LTASAGRCSDSNASSLNLFRPICSAVANVAKSAPLISECPLRLECKLVDTVESGLNEIFIGEVVGAFTEERFLIEGKMDFQKMKPPYPFTPGHHLLAPWGSGGRRMECREKIQIKTPVV